MPPALGTFPELLRRPGAAWQRVTQFHLRPTSLTADLDLDIGHAPNSIIACMVEYQPETECRSGVLIPAVVLAAGRSSRMGRAKALLPAGPGEPTFIGRIVRVLREGGVDDVLVVVSADSPETAEGVAQLHLPARVVLNSDPSRGQLSSLKVGLHTIDRPGVGGMMVTLVDVPLISPGTVRALLSAHRETQAPVVRPVRAGRHGHPVIFHRSVFDDLRQASDETGAKAVVRAHASESVAVPIEEDGPFRDIDTPVDYERSFGQAIPVEPGARR